jgi:tetratricopeptide (TPR) repeat protein
MLEKINHKSAPKEVVNALVTLYHQGKYDDVLSRSSLLIKEYPHTFVLHNIMGAIFFEKGQKELAIEHFRKVIELRPHHPHAYNNLGATLIDIGEYQEAKSKLKKALELQPDYPEAYNNLGNAHKEMEEYNEAIPIYEKAIELNPQYYKAYNNLGVILGKNGEYKEAIESYNKAVLIKPDFAEAYNNIGIALKEQSKIDEAIEAYNKALSLKPDYAEVYYNTGVALKDQGKLEEAIKSYNKALSLKPDFAEAYNNMGIALRDQGKLDEAIEAYNKALSIKPDYAEAYNNMGVELSGVIFKKPNKGLQHTISSLLDKKLHARPADIAVAAISLLKFEPSLQKQLKSIRSVELIHNPLEIISDLDQLPLLRNLMSVCPLPDLELEKLFKKLRASILENFTSLKKASPELLRFQSALALQCFTNEYVYSQSQNEEKAINVLEKQIKELLSNNEQPSPQMILILASYKALHKYDWCQLLIVTNQIQDVFTRQVEEPNQEEKLKLNLPILEEISDKVSSSVRQQYEESPYPRWVNLGLNLEPAPISKIVEELQLKLHYEKINKVKNPNILVAGCGTGQHSITTAARFNSSKVLAIDLSLSSLAYAKRKTKEFTIENIEYMQADILDLGKFNKQFDIIESLGVLHHMDNPIQGWKVLTDCLKPGGLMKIGLYSELARQHIVKIREEIRQTGIGSSNAEMRSFRETIIRSDIDHHKLIIKSPDFYSLSTLRDLLFHVQEHRFTIPLIKDHLNKLGLKFSGFESSKIVSHFKQTNKNKEDPYDLDKWQAYEEANPLAFLGMYQFWCQKGL